jgi:hypothetical protein
MISLFKITRLKVSFEYQIWREKIKNQLIFMNFWHYVEIENVELIDLIAIVSISIIFVILEKFRKIKINNLKIVTILKNRLNYNDKNLLKNEINAKNAWKILKNSFNSFKSKKLNDLLIKFWNIIFVNNQNVTNYVRRFKTMMQNIREMIFTYRSMTIFSFCIFIWILTRSSSNIASIMLIFTRLCQTNRILFKTLITRSLSQHNEARGAEDYQTNRPR